MPKGVYEHKQIPAVNRYQKYVVKRPGCWGWTGATSRGYGQLMCVVGPDRYRPISASRISWELHNGPIPEGVFVLHKCDNPECTNPEHLWLGTDKDNMHDMYRKGRHGEGKLNMELANHIREQYRRNNRRGRIAELARKYCVSEAMISGIIHGKSWCYA